jgi:hypothetical protein
MKELLDRLKELDLETYNSFLGRTKKILLKTNIPVQEVPEHIQAAYEIEISFDDRDSMAILQDVIQNAIKKRRKNQEYIDRWLWSVIELGDVHCHASIRSRGGKDIADAIKSSSAEALLCAYITALENLQCQS